MLVRRLAALASGLAVALTLASCTDARLPAAPDPAPPVHFQGALATGLWSSYGSGARNIAGVQLQLTEAPDGSISGTWSGGYGPCGCQLSGVVLPADSHRTGVMFSLHATVEGYPAADQMTFDAEMLGAKQLRGMMDVFSSRNYEEGGNTVQLSR